MNTQKITQTTITIEDLVRTALETPTGWKREIYVEKDGEVTFSNPMTPNSRTGIDAYTPLDTYVCDLKAMNINDFEGYFVRDDGKVERVNEMQGEGVKGEYYDSVDILTFDEAVSEIASWIEDEEFWINILNSITQKTFGAADE